MGLSGPSVSKLLPEGFSLRLKGAVQGSDSNLLASEQMGAGGYDSIRGYDQRVARGDQGLTSADRALHARNFDRQAHALEDTRPTNFASWPLLTTPTCRTRIVSKTSQVQFRNAQCGCRLALALQRLVPAFVLTTVFRSIPRASTGSTTVAASISVLPPTSEPSLAGNSFLCRTRHSSG